MKFSNIFFDLDHTLWDYDRNAGETLKDLYSHYRLNEISALTKDEFVNFFLTSNAHYWKLFNQGEIDKEELRLGRFEKILAGQGNDLTQLAAELAEDFSTNCPKKTYLMPNALRVLHTLKEKNYQLHIITNGFIDSQVQKMRSSGIQHFFTSVTTSECSGYRKPSKEIFTIAHNKAMANKEESLMIGDNLDTDINGAKNAGIEAVWYNANKDTSYEKLNYRISDLLDLLKII